ncbi:MAG: hypothetical protein KGI60_02550 [Patescibacteria group bacterium]|nr:hypothetical protein [Patescibacteria group bacterium]
MIFWSDEAYEKLGQMDHSTREALRIEFKKAINNSGRLVATECVCTDGEGEFFMTTLRAVHDYRVIWTSFGRSTLIWIVTKEHPKNRKELTGLMHRSHLGMAPSFLDEHSCEQCKSKTA